MRNITHAHTHTHNHSKYYARTHMHTHIVTLNNRLRNGGYTRVVRIGHRYGDAADRAIIEFIDRYKLGVSE